jgi:hypothetical protein
MSIKKEDLIQTCTECGGAGEIDLSNSNSQNNSFGGRVVRYSNIQSCNRCWHTGEILTEQGEAISSLIQLVKRQNKF